MCLDKLVKKAIKVNGWRWGVGIVVKRNGGIGRYCCLGRL
jgi:hypothetical protein